MHLLHCFACCSLVAISTLPTSAQGKASTQPPSKPAAAPTQGSKVPASKQGAAPKKTYQLGQVLDPQIKLVDLEDRVVSLGSFRGKVVVLDFWSIRCPISIRYEERLKKLHADLAGKDVVILAVNPNNRELDRKAKDPAHKIKAYIKKAKVPYRVLVDPNHRLADALQANTTPHAFVLDRELRLVYEGGIDSDRQWYASNRGEQPEPWLRQAIDATLAGRLVENQSTKEWGCGIKRVRKPRPARKARSTSDDASAKKKVSGSGVDR